MSFSDFFKRKKIQFYPELFSDLTKAAVEGNVSFFQKVADAFPKLFNKVNERGYTPANFAAANGHADCLKIIAEVAPDSLNIATEDGNTVAHSAASGGHTNCLSIIAEVAPDLLNTVNKNGETPALLATFNGHADCLKTIAETAPDSLNTVDGFGDTPADLAVKHGHGDCLQIITEASPTTLPQEKRLINIIFNAANSGDVTTITEIAYVFPKLFNKVNKHGYTPAHFAAGEGHANCLKIIAKTAPDALKKAEKKYGYTPAHFAAGEGHADCLKIIAKTTPGALNVENEIGVTPAHIASGEGHVECLKIIAEIAPDSLKKVNKNGETPADIATRKGHVDCIAIINKFTKMQNSETKSNSWVVLDGQQALEQAIDLNLISEYDAREAFVIRINFVIPPQKGDFEIEGTYQCHGCRKRNTFTLEFSVNSSEMYTLRPCEKCTSQITIYFSSKEVVNVGKVWFLVGRLFTAPRNKELFPLRILVENIALK